MKFKLHNNGFIIKKETEYKFYGLTDDIWPIDLDTPKLEKQVKKKLFDYCESNVRRSWENDKVVEVSNNIDFINQYIYACELADIKYQILFCCSEKEIPQINISSQDLYEKFVFLGYDYAYPGGSFYSCIYNDLFFKRVHQFNCFRLNQYGLFNNEKDLINFIDLRIELQKKSSIHLFEKGDFVVFKLWRYTGNVPISL